MSRPAIFWGEEARLKKQTKELERIAEEKRQKVIAFKRFFGSDHGKEVMLDLMNKFHVLTPLPKDDVERAEGKREVVLYILGLANVDLARLDKIMKGDFE